MSTGFEIETELIVHALDLDLPMSELETDYRERPPGSASKLSTIKDGLRILWLILHLVRDLLPLQFSQPSGRYPSSRPLRRPSPSLWNSWRPVLFRACQPRFWRLA